MGGHACAPIITDTFEKVSRYGDDAKLFCSSLTEAVLVIFTPHPGIVAEFGTIVNRIGRGLPMR